MTDDELNEIRGRYGVSPEASPSDPVTARALDDIARLIVEVERLRRMVPNRDGDSEGTPGREPNPYAKVWRVLAHEEKGDFEEHNRGNFDELVVGQWIHLEQMDTEQWWMRVGDARVWVTLEGDGAPVVDILRGYHGVMRGTTGGWSAT